MLFFNISGEPSINYVHLIVLWDEKQIDLTLIGIFYECYDMYVIVEIEP